MSDPDEGAPDAIISEEQLPDLIKPYKALKRLRYHFGGPPTTKAVLADLIRDGEIRAFARYSWVSEEKSLVRARKSRPRDAERGIQIRPAQLMGNRRWTEIATRWKWKRGDFFAIIRAKPIKRLIFSNVRFSKEDVEQVLQDANDALKEARSNRGKKPKLEVWHKVWFEVLAIAAAGRLTKKHFPEMHNFRTEVSVAVVGNGADGGLKEKTFSPLLNQIYRKFVNPEAN